jgi:hypothetical protein
VSLASLLLWWKNEIRFEIMFRMVNEPTIAFCFARIYY